MLDANKLHFLRIAALAALSASSACSRNDSELARLPDAAATTAAPKLVVDEPLHDFGFVTQGDSREHAFKLTNTGSAPLVIESVSASCACTVAELAERRLVPGASTLLKVRYRPTSMTGPDHQTISLRSNDPELAVFELNVNAVVSPDIRFEPPSLQLGAVPIRQEVVSQLKGNAVIRANLHLAELRGDPTATAAVQVKVSSGPYDPEHRPEIRAALKRRTRNPGQVIAVVLTGLPDPTQILVPIEWGKPPAGDSHANETAH